MYANELKTKEKQKLTEIKNQLQHIQVQTCQLSRFCRESHDFLSFITVSRQGSSISRVLGKIILK